MPEWGGASPRRYPDAFIYVHKCSFASVRLSGDDNGICRDYTNMGPIGSGINMPLAAQSESRRCLHMVARSRQLSLKPISVALLALAFHGPLLAARPTGTLPILLSHSCSAQEIMNHGDGTWYFIKYHLNHQSSINDQGGLSEDGLRRTVASLMSRRAERLVYVAADPRLPYGEVLDLVSDLTRDDPSLHVVLLTEKQTGRFVSFSWRHFTSFCLSMPRG